MASTELCAPAPKRPEGVWIAGTGAGIAPLRMLADAYASEANSLPIHVPVSIGTSGGLRALEAGEIDLAITARPLTDKERERGLRQHKLASARVVFVTQKTLEEEERALDHDTLRSIYEGKTRTWPDGRAITPLFREEGDSGLRLLRARAPRLGEALSPPTRDARRGLVLHTDQQMRDALLEIDGSIGWLHKGMITTESLPLSPLTVMLEDRTPLEVDLPLYLVTREVEQPDARAFLAFTKSERARKLLESHGYDAP